MATVTDFSEAELWYIYEALTTQTFAGATQQEIWEIFNGTNPQGLAISLFDTSIQRSLADWARLTTLNTNANSNNNLTIADQLSENVTINKTPIGDILYYSNNYLSAIDNNIGQIENWTNLTHTYLSTVRTPVLTSITGSLTVAPAVHNISIYNSGASAGTINVNAGGAISIPAGVTVNYDAGGNNNRYAANSFVLNATGTTFIVSYTS